MLCFEQNVANKTLRTKQFYVVKKKNVGCINLVVQRFVCDTACVSVKGDRFMFVLGSLG